MGEAPDWMRAAAAEWRSTWTPIGGKRSRSSVGTQTRRWKFRCRKGPPLRELNSRASSFGPTRSERCRLRATTKLGGSGSLRAACVFVGPKITRPDTSAMDSVIEILREKRSTDHRRMAAAVPRPKRSKEADEQVVWLRHRGRRRPARSIRPRAVRVWGASRREPGSSLSCRHGQPR